MFGGIGEFRWRDASELGAEQVQMEGAEGMVEVDDEEEWNAPCVRTDAEAEEPHGTGCSPSGSDSEDWGSEPQMGYLWLTSLFECRWRRRFFFLAAGGCTLRYKKRASDSDDLGSVPIAGCSVGVLPAVKSHPTWVTFYLHTTSAGTFALAAESLDEAQRWVSKLVSAPQEGPACSDAGRDARLPSTPKVGEERRIAKGRAGEGRTLHTEVPSEPNRSSECAAKPVEQLALLHRVLKDMMQRRDGQLAAMSSECERLRSDVQKARIAEQEKGEEIRRGAQRIQELEKHVQSLEQDAEVAREREVELHDEVRAAKDELSSSNAAIDEVTCELQHRIQLHSDAELRYIELKNKLSDMEAAVVKPFWSPSK